MDTELDLQRLTRLGETLGSAPAEIARTLGEEMTRALGAIDAGLAEGDLSAVAQASHAARNSALLIDARPVLAHLNELERCARRDGREATLAARQRLDASWAQLLARLAQLASETLP